MATSTPSHQMFIHLGPVYKPVIIKYGVVTPAEFNDLWNSQKENFLSIARCNDNYLLT